MQTKQVKYCCDDPDCLMTVTVAVGVRPMGWYTSYDVDLCQAHEDGAIEFAKKLAEWRSEARKARKWRDMAYMKAHPAPEPPLSIQAVTDHIRPF